MTVAVGLVVACMFLRLMVTNRSLVTEPFRRWSGEMYAPIQIYLVLLAIQFVHSLVRYGQPLTPVLGLIFYTAPLIAISVAYSQFDRFARMKDLLMLHCAFAVLVAITVLLAFNGVESNLLGEVGDGLTIYDQGTVLKAYSGLMRSSEIAGWHMGASACFLLILLTENRSVRKVVLTVVIILLLMTAIILTGRRKMIFQLLVFGVLYFPFLRLYQRRAADGYFMTIIVLGLVAIGLIAIIAPMITSSQFELYVMRGSTVFGDATGRFEQLGVGSIGWAFNRFGFFGGGLGIAAQGAQHLSGAVAVAGGAAEGGLGKIVSELGAVSLLLIAWLLYVIAKHIHNCLSLVAKVLPDRLPFAVGVAVFAASNAPTFIVASQVFGDVFILTIIGLTVGFIFAIPKLVINDLDIATPKVSHRMQIRA